MEFLLGLVIGLILGIAVTVIAATVASTGEADLHPHRAPPGAKR